MHVCTIVAHNYLAQARVLARSLKAADPDATLWVLVVDGVHEGDEEPFELVAPQELDLGDDLAVMRLIYDVTELSTALKPALLRTLLRRTGGPVTYLDPDIEVFASLGEVVRLADTHGLVLTPHLLAPLPDDERQPTDVDILLSGAYNLGFVSMADRPDVHALLDWWDRSLRRDCIIDHSHGRFVDQRFMDLALGFVDDHFVLRDPGYNVAYWNLSQRELQRNGTGITVSGHPLRFFHYSGYDPRRPLRISRHQSRLTFDDVPVVAELYASYAAALRAEGFTEQARLPYAYDRTPAGLVLDLPLRRLLRNAFVDGELPDTLDAFSPDGDAQLTAWLNEPASDGPLAGIPRVLAWVAGQRDDLTRLFGHDPAGLVQWAREYGVREEPALTHVVDAWPVAAPASGGPGEPEPGSTGVDTLPAPGPARRHPWGVNVAGFMRAELGIGEAARQALAALDEAGIPALPVEGRYVPSSRQAADVQVRPTADAPYAINLVCVSPDVLEQWVAGVEPAFFDGRRTIGFWWWEVARIPDQFRPSFDLVDEVWCGSRFVRDTFAAGTSKPVIQVTIPVVVPEPPRLTREHLMVPSDFLFLFLFDFNSVLERKNPLGLVEAFTRAFAPGDGTSLLIKSINADRHPEKAAILRAAIDPLPHAHLIDRYVSAGERDALLASADCYVSLHRSEGFGLTPAESMYLGKPVIATGWSGNLDFMTAENSYLVDHTLVDVGPEGAPYPADGQWAEPDLDHAAALMRRVFTDRDEADARGAQAAADLRRTHSLEVAAASMAGRLETLREMVSPESVLARDPSPVFHAAGLARQSAELRRGGSVPRRALLRGLRPYTFHQDRVTEALVDALGQLEERLDMLDLRTAVARAEAIAATRRLQARLERSAGELRAALRAERADGRAHTDEVAAELVRRLADEVAPLHELRGSHPDSRTLPFTAFAAEGVGQVYGFRGDIAPIADDDERYRRFEDLFRGSEETIAARQAVYVDLLRDAGPVLDIGCGRGELLELLRDAGVPARGVDLDPGMVARCVEKDLDVVLGDGVAALEALPDESLGAVFCAQVIEHLPYADFQRLFALAVRRVRPGGCFIAETVNPHSAIALKHFWLDLTHEQPVFPEVALATAGLAGFSEAYIFFPGGSGDAEADRPRMGDYALVATR